MLIQIREMFRTYEVGEEKVHALNGVDLDIEQNEYVAIMGPSGSGKSTLMNILGCLDTPSKGTYRLKDQEIEKLSDDELARIRNQEIGFVFQLNRWTPITVRELHPRGVTAVGSQLFIWAERFHSGWYDPITGAQQSLLGIPELTELLDSYATSPRHLLLFGYAREIQSQ